MAAPSCTRGAIAKAATRASPVGPGATGWWWCCSARKMRTGPGTWSAGTPSAITAGESSELIARGDGEEPHAHHCAHDSPRREFRHNREADGAQAQLADRMQKVQTDEPPRTHEHSPFLCQLCRRDDQGKSQSHEDQPQREFYRARRLARPEANPQPREERGHAKAHEHRIQRLIPR